MRGDVHSLCSLEETQGFGMKARWSAFLSAEVTEPGLLMRLQAPDQGHPASPHIMLHPPVLSGCRGQTCANVCAAATAQPLPSRFPSGLRACLRVLGSQDRVPGRLPRPLDGSSSFPTSLPASPAGEAPSLKAPEEWPRACPSQAGRWPTTLGRDHPGPQQLRVLESSHVSRSPSVSSRRSPGHCHPCPQALTMAAVGGHFSSVHKAGSERGSCADGAEATGRRPWSYAVARPVSPHS